MSWLNYTEICCNWVSRIDQDALVKPVVLEEFIKSIDKELESEITISRNGKQLELKATILERIFRINYISLKEPANATYLEMQNYPEYTENVDLLSCSSYAKYSLINDWDSLEYKLFEEEQKTAFINLLTKITKKIGQVILTSSTNCVGTDKYLTFLFKLVKILVNLSCNSYYTDVRPIVFTDQAVNFELTDELTTFKMFTEHRFVLEITLGSVTTTDQLHLENAEALAHSIDDELDKFATLSKNAKHLLFKLDTYLNRIRDISDFAEDYKTPLDYKDDFTPLGVRIGVIIALYRTLFLGYQSQSSLEISVLISYEVDSWPVPSKVLYYQFLKKLFRLRMQSALTRSTEAISITPTNKFLDRLFSFVLGTVEVQT